MFNILAGYQFNKEWSVSGRWYLSSGVITDSYKIYSDVHNNPNLMRYSKEITGNNDCRLHAAHSLNIRIDYRKQFDWFALITFLDIMNVYGNKNITREDFLPQTGKHSEEALETLPSFGIKVEF